MSKTFDSIEFPKISESVQMRLNTGIDKIEQLLKFICVEDEFENGQIKEIKNKIYKLYSNQINDLINKYEVYIHNFSNEVSVAIMDVVNQLSLVSTIIDEAEQIKQLNDTYNLLYCLHYILCLEISSYCLEQVNKYKKIIKKFNYKGVNYIPDKDEDPSLGDNKFFEIINQREKNLEDKLRKYDSIFKSLIDKTNSQFDYYNLDNIANTMVGDATVEDLTEFANASDKFLKDVERHYPKIIDNGYSPPLWQRCLNFVVFWAVPIALAVVTIILKVTHK